MEFLEYGGRLYEITIFGSVDEDRLVLECVDMAADGGLVLTLRRDPMGRLMIQPAGREFPPGLAAMVEAIGARELPTDEGTRNEGSQDDA
jgi:hypothetical protein